MDFDAFVSNYSLLDSELLTVKFLKSEYNVQVELCLKLRSGEVIRFTFNKIKDYCFSYSDDAAFYIVTHYKLLLIDDETYYLSLDPFDEKHEIDSRDNDFIRGMDLSIELVN